MAASVLVCGAIFDGVSDEITGPTQILVRDALITEIDSGVDRPDGSEMIYLSERTVSPGLSDTPVHLTMDATDLAVRARAGGPAAGERDTRPRRRAQKGVRHG